MNMSLIAAMASFVAIVTVGSGLQLEAASAPWETALSLELSNALMSAAVLASTCKAQGFPNKGPKSNISQRTKRQKLTSLCRSSHHRSVSIRLLLSVLGNSFLEDLKGSPWPWFVRHWDSGTLGVELVASLQVSSLIGRNHPSGIHVTLVQYPAAVLDARGSVLC